MTEPKIRPQYHLRPTEQGIDAFDVKRLIKLTSNLEVFEIDPNNIAEIHQDHWYFQNTSPPTPLSIIEHAQLIRDCDLSYPIILDASGRVMDGMHRICKAIMEQQSKIKAVQFKVDPDPCYKNCNPDELPYDT